MRAYIIKSLLILSLAQGAFASEYIDKLIKKDKVTESEYIVHYNEAKAIESVKGLIAKHQGTKLEPQLRHRLADLYVRQSQTRNFVDQLKKRKNKSLEQVFETLPEKKSLLKKAIFQLQTVEKSYPRYAAMDEVLHTMGMSYFKINEISLAERPFLKITKRYKRSPLLQDARLSLGEITYFQKRYKTAIKYFSYIARDNSNKSQTYGHYKRGWARYYLGDYKRGYDDLKNSYLISNKEPKKFNLSHEVLEDIPLFAAEIFKGHQIERAFSQFIKDRKNLESTMDAQAVVYNERSEYGNEISVLESLYKRKSEVNDKFDLSYRLAKAHENIDNLVAMAQYYKKADSLMKHKVDPNTKQELLVFGRNVVKQRYKEWTKGQKKFDIRPVLVVGDLGHGYIKDKKERAKFVNVLADLNLDVKDYAKSSHYYELASDLTTASGKAHELLYSSLFTLEKAVGKSKWNSNQVKRQRSLVSKYRQRFPNGKYMIDVLYKFARVENVHGSKKIALNVFLELGAKYPTSSKGQEAQDFVVSIYEKAKNYAAVNEYLEKIVPKTRNKNRQKKLAKIYDNSFFLIAQQNEKRNRYQQAVGNYKSYIQKSFLKEKLIGAQWNIALAYKSGRLYRSSAEAFLDFYNKYRKHERSMPALEESFALFEKVKDLNKLEHVALLLEQNTKGRTQLEWRLTRAKIRVQNAKFKPAENLFYDLVKVSDKKISDDAHQYLFNHVDKKRNSRFKNASLRVLQTGKEPFKSEALLRVGMTYLADGNEKMARSKFNKILASGDALNESKAKAAIFVAEMDMKSFRMPSPASSMSFDQTVAYLERLMARVTPVTQKFQAVIGFSHNESSLRAYVELAKVYLNLNVALSRINVRAQADLKLAVDREVRNLKMTARSSFYESYEMALNLMSRDRKLRSKYNREVKKIRKDFDEFNNEQNVAARGK